MPPELPSLLVILDTSFRDGTLVGRAEYFEGAPLRVRWGFGTPPKDYVEEGGGVVFVANENPDRREADEHAPIMEREKELNYSYEEGMGKAKWLMLVMILPSGHALDECDPPPAGSRLFGEDRLAYYWRLKSPGKPKIGKLKWSLRPTSDVGKELRRDYTSAPFPFDAGEVPEFGIFVSYRREETKWAAGRIKDWLSRELGPRAIFRDTDSIRAGKDFREEIDAAVGQCRIMLAVIGTNWLRSSRRGKRQIDLETDWVRIEIESALQRHRVVIPVLLDDAKMPDEPSLPESLRELAFLHAYKLREENFDREVNGLIEQLRAHLSESQQ